MNLDMVIDEIMFIFWRPAWRVFFPLPRPLQGCLACKTQLRGSRLLSLPTELNKLTTT